MTTAHTVARIVVTRRFTSDPMIVRFLVNIIRVMTGIGRVKLRTTWLSTNVRVGSRPRAITINVGIIVEIRRIQIGIRKPTNPCMTTCPAMVPTWELEIPDAISEIRKTAAAPPQAGE